MTRSPWSPRVSTPICRVSAANEVDGALKELIAEGYTDDRLGDPQRIKKRMLPGRPEG